MGEGISKGLWDGFPEFSGARKKSKGNPGLIASSCIVLIVSCKQHRSELLYPGTDSIPVSPAVQDIINALGECCVFPFCEPCPILSVRRGLHNVILTSVLTFIGTFT